MQQAAAQSPLPPKPIQIRHPTRRSRNLLLQPFQHIEIQYFLLKIVDLKGPIIHRLVQFLHVLHGEGFGQQVEADQLLFAHPSPNNKWIVYIAYTSDEKQSHLFGKNVKLCLMNTKSKAIKDITPVFYGGQGTINVPSWSADGKKVAFVSYSVK